MGLQYIRTRGTKIVTPHVSPIISCLTTALLPSYFDKYNSSSCTYFNTSSINNSFTVPFIITNLLSTCLFLLLFSRYIFLLLDVGFLHAYQALCVYVYVYICLWCVQVQSLENIDAISNWFHFKTHNQVMYWIHSNNISYSVFLQIVKIPLPKPKFLLTQQPK